jgi:chaperone required for assembly of F1-ATPase
MQRFWDIASAEPDVFEPGDGFYRILLDGKPVRLPGGGLLRISGAALAKAVAAEWQSAGGAKGGQMTFADVPLTRLAGTAQERIAADPGPTVAALAAYGATDLLCYRASEPETLVRRQDRLWQPWLDWAEASFGARLIVTRGIMPVAQDARALAALASVVAAQPVSVLAALGIAVPGLGSLVLGLALASFRLEAAAAHELACLDERFQAELWGEDTQAAARRQAVAADVALAQHFIALSVGGAA